MRGEASMKTLPRLVFIAALLAAPSAWAVTDVCVATNNDLQAALLQAENAPLAIKVMKGTYRLDLTSWGIASDFPFVLGGTSVVGGYVNNCASRDIDASSTVLTDDGVGDNDAYSISVAGDFALDGLTFNLSSSFVMYDSSYHSNPTLNVRRSVFTGAPDSTHLAIFWNGDNFGTGTVRISDSLIHGGASGVCAFGLVTDSGYVTYTLVNDTIMNSNGVGICLQNPASIYESSYAFYNTIAYNNGIDLQTDSQYVTLVDDTFGTIDQPAPFSPSPVGLKTTDPQLSAGYVPIAPNSPSIDSGTAILPGGLSAYDIAGNPRVVGGGVDRGAYESPYDASTKQTVTNTANAGAGSLRQAIKDANLNAGANSIVFNLPGNCPRVIAVDSNLDAITGDTTINGYTQSGTSRNTLDTGDDANICIIVEPSAGSTATDGIRVASGAGNGVNLTVQGLALGGFSGDAIGLKGGSAHSINGNHFGGSVNGHALSANGFDIRIGAGVHDSIVGGDGAGQRNIIGDATNSGIYIAGTNTPAHDNQIVNNYIGLGWGTALTNRGNGTNGIYLAGANNTISGNFIGDNANDGIDIDTSAATGNTITGNSIGGDFNVGTLFGNGLAGVRVENAAGDNTITSNTIANNANAGVRVVTGMHNKIRKNAIYTNGNLGIDLAAVGVTANDPDGGVIAVDYANRGQNFPILTTAAGGHFSGQVSGTLSTTPGDYTVDLYLGSGCDASGNGEGRLWLRGATITVPVPAIGTQGLASFAINIDTDFPDILTGSTITSTATDSLGNTSEFSACRAYVDDTLFANGFQGAAF